MTKIFLIFFKTLKVLFLLFLELLPIFLLILAPKTRISIFFLVCSYFFISLFLAFLKSLVGIKGGST